jgi:hypothetical protein
MWPSHIELSHKVEFIALPTLRCISVSGKYDFLRTYLQLSGVRWGCCREIIIRKRKMVVSTPTPPLPQFFRAQYVRNIICRRIIWLSPQWCLSLNFNHFTGQRDFKFMVPWKAFMNVRCTIGSMWRIIGPYNPPQSALAISKCSYLIGNCIRDIFNFLFPKLHCTEISATDN